MPRSHDEAGALSGSRGGLGLFKALGFRVLGFTVLGFRVLGFEVFCFLCVQGLGSYCVFCFRALGFSGFSGM